MLRTSTHQTVAITVTTQDYDRLSALVDRYAEGRLAALADALDEELSRARVVEQNAIPPDVVTMNATCRFRFVDTAEEREVTLVYPADADVDAGRVSVLAPIGTALLGLSVGQRITWETPEGDRTIEVVALRYQPEAAGDLTL